MQKIGITGQNGFIGKYLYNSIKINAADLQIVPFDREFFENENKLDQFVQQCDVIIHLAGLNRHSDPEIIYSTNIELARKLVHSFKRTSKSPFLIFASSTQEERDNHYGRSKLESRLIFKSWAEEHEAQFCGLVIPNVFGPFCQPFYNSVIATFSYQLLNNQIPRVEKDTELKLIYVGELADRIINIIRERNCCETFFVTHTAEIKVSEILVLLKEFKSKYLNRGLIPEVKSSFELYLFNTFRSYIDIENQFPVKFKTNVDTRGVFTELVRLDHNMSGQISFSTTIPGVIRGNHFHTRKIERFAVIKGEALIQLRRVGENKVYDFYLSGNVPAYVDMPIWTIHNIKNIGSEDLYTIFWINELYDAEDSDTYFEEI